MQLNSTRPLAGVLATLVFLYAIYAVMTSDPLARINRMCTPFFIWPGKAVVSAVNLFAPDAAAPVAAKFDSGFQMCRKWAWMTFYQAEYDRMMRQLHTPGGAS